MSNPYSYYGSGGSSSGGGGGNSYSYYGSSGGGGKKKQKHHSFWGSVAEPFVNAGKTIAGIGPGIYVAGRDLGESIVHPNQKANKAAWDALLHGHPIRAWQIEKKGNKFERQVVQPMLDAYKYKYGSGDPLKIIHRALIEDPFGTFLDFTAGGTALTAGAVGAARAARAAGVGSEAGRVARIASGAPTSVTLRSLTREGAVGGATTEKYIRGSEFSRYLKSRASKLANQLPPDLPLVGEYRRFGKAEKAQAQRTMLAGQFEQAPYTRARRGLNKAQLVALDVLHDYPTPQAVDRYVAHLRTVGTPAAEATIRQLEDPKVRKWIENPGPKLGKALQEARVLGDKGAEVRGLNVVDETTGVSPADVRRYQQLLLQNGARFAVDEQGVTKMLSSGKISDFRKNQIERVLSQPEGDALVPGRVVHAADQNNYGYVTRAGDTSSDVHFISPDGAEATVTLSNDLLTPINREQFAKANGLDLKLQAPEGTTIPDMIDRIRGDLAAQGRHEPVYRPHKTAQDLRGTRVGSGGSREPRSVMHASEGALAAAGRVAYGIDSLGPDWLRLQKTQYYHDIYDRLAAAAERVPPNARLEPGEEFLPRRNEKIPFMERSAQDFERHITSFNKETASLFGERAKIDPEILENGDRLVIPTSLRKAMVEEFTQHGRVFDNLLRKPTDVWRALVLNARPGWLVNNVVGNTFLFLLLHPNAMRSWLQAVSDTHGVDFVIRKLLNDRQIASRMTPEDMAHVLPDQVQGAFLASQLPPAGKAGFITHGKYSPLRWLRSVDIGYEQALRRAISNDVIRRSPEAKAIYKAMPKQTRSWRQAMNQAARHPSVVERAANEANATLGNYLNMTPLERGAIRAAIPFYGWYRAITQIAAKLAIDTPIRANLLANIGKMGELYDAEGYPYGGAIPLGGQAILKTAGVNPLETIPSVAKSGSVIGRALIGQIPGAHMSAVDPADVGYAAGGIFNPFIAAPLSGGVSALTQGLPELQVAFPRKPHHPEKSLYTDYDRVAMLLQYLGVPIRHLRPTQ